jgi:hypothetical protein
MRRFHHFATLACALSLVVAHAAQAQNPTPPAAVASDDPVDTLRTLDRQVRVEFEGLRGPWGKNPAVERARLDGARRTIDDVRARLAATSTTGEQALRARMVVEKNLGRLERETSRGERMHAVTAAEAVILAKHKAGQPADVNELKNLEDAIRALQNLGGEGWAATARHHAERVEQVKRDRTTLLAVATAAEAVRLKRAELDDAMRAANRARRQIETHLEDAREPVPTELMMAHQMATDRVVSLNKDAGSYYIDEHQALELASTWREKNSDARDTAITQQLAATFIDSGVAKTNALKVSIPADADWCYAVVMRFAKDTGDEEVADVRFKAAKGSLSRFVVPHRGVGWQGFTGACVDTETRIAVTGRITKKGKNDLGYVIVGWPRATFPRTVARYMGVILDDPCDTDAWLATWTRPVPGAIVYRADTPFVVVQAERPSKDTVTLLSLTGERVFDVKKSEVTSKSPATRKLDMPFAWKGCPGVEVAEHPDSVKLAKCHDGIDRYLGAPLRNAMLSVERASTDAAREKAEREVTRLKDKDSAERVKKCEPIEEKIRERSRRAYERTLDHHTENVVEAPFDRASDLQAQMAAQPDLR